MGYRIERLDSIDKVLQLMTAEHDDHLGRNRDLKVFRGINDSSYCTYTSLQRNCGDVDEKKRRHMEKLLLNNFAKYAEQEDPNLNKSEWHKMIIGQHHGLPTRLLDWTRSPAVALHFAMTESNWDMLDQRDCAVWCLDVKKMNEQLPDPFKDQLKDAGQGVFTVNSLIETRLGKGKGRGMTVEEFDRQFTRENPGMVMLEPPTIDIRIANQYSFFSVIPSCVSSVDEILEKLGDDCVIKYEIDRNLRWEIRDMLDRMNISERLIYPGLDGIAKWLARYYYPRKIQRFEILKKNICDAAADVIAAPCSPDFAPGKAGSAILYAAGSAVEEERHVRLDGALAEFQAGNLEPKVKKIYFVVGQDVWEDNKNADKLMKLYLTAMEHAYEDGYHSIAFPLIGTGNYGYKETTAWRAAIAAKDAFFGKHPDELFTVSICVTSEKQFLVGDCVKKGLDDAEIEDEVQRRLCTGREYRNLNRCSYVRRPSH